MDAFVVDPGSLAGAYSSACSTLEQSGFVNALWSRSLEVWPGGHDVRRAIGNRLGWLGALDFITPHLTRLEAFAASVRSGGFTDVVLLGMGGSSLAPEVLRHTLGVAPGFPRFHVLDSVDPDAVRGAMANAASSLFILASKSGTTIEPNVMAAEARRRLLAAGYKDWGPRFVAITDEGTALYRRGTEDRFRDVFVNPSDIGGRYSALSYFGMVPASLLGIDLERFVQHGRAMEHACHEPGASGNPGASLGALMAAGVQNGRDKLTLLLPERLRSFGLWVEQLVAESTGKAGTGVVPIVGDPTATPIGDDRLVVAVNAGSERVDPVTIERVRAEGVPLAVIESPETLAVGAEFLRWEIATAAAGLLLGINPFDEPNVQQAKDATRALLEVYTSQRRLPTSEPIASIDGARLSLSHAAAEALGGESAATFLRLLKTRDYFCLLAYVPPDDERFDGPLRDIRARVAERTGCATMFGYGPRYLHSTGQLHKGGSNTGVFLILTADADADLPVPDASFTFGVLETAQALGDFQSLERTGRRALHIHLPDRNPDRVRAVMALLLEAVSRAEL